MSIIELDTIKKDDIIDLAGRTRRSCCLFISTFLLTCFSLYAYGQKAEAEDHGHQKIDSLLALLAEAKEDTATALLYKTICEEYDYAGDIEKTREYCFKLRDLSEKLNFNEGYFVFVSNYSGVLIKESKFDSIVIINNKALELAIETGNSEREAASRINIGMGYNLKEFLETALEYFFEALKYYESTRDSSSIGHVYDMIQTVYWDMERFDDAVVYSEKAIGLLATGYDPYIYCVSLLNLSCT